MVLLKEISEGIWGLALGPNNISEVTTDHPFRLTMAALEIDDGEESESTPNGITRVTIKSSTADKGPATDLILCNLQYPACLQQPLDIEFYEGQTLTFGVKGPHKVHLTGYVLQPEPQEMHEEGHLPIGKGKGFFQAADESSSDDDDDDDDDDDSDDDDDEEDALHLARPHRLRDDEDQDLEGDYEDGYLEGEDQLGSETSSPSDSDNDEQQKTSVNKNKKRPRAESNGHPNKQEPQMKKIKKTKTNQEETTKTNDNESKKSKKLTKKPASTTSVDANASSTTADDKKKSNALQINDIRVGNGTEAKLGKTVAVYYTGRLKSNNLTFDSCVKGKPFRFRLGAGEVIRGWDQGVKGMCVGGKRRLTIPPSLAYGTQKLPDIPANSTLIFDIELKNVF